MPDKEDMEKLANRLEKQGYVKRAHVTDFGYNDPKINVTVTDSNRFGEVQNIAIKHGEYQVWVEEYHPHGDGMDVVIEPI